MSLPLEDLRIIAVSQYGAGPFATMHLADLGAEVIKIEDPSTGGDSARLVIPYAQDGDSLFYQSLNRNKKSITLDFRTAEAKEVFFRLVKVSDAVLNNLRGDQPKKLGLDYESLKSVNPKIVCVSLSGYGTSGSKALEPAYDYIVQAYTGLQSITGEPNGPPTRFGISVIDFTSAFAAAMALMIGLHQASRTGQGCDIDVSMHDVAISMLNYLAAWHLNRGYVPKKTADSAHPTLVPSQNFRTKDGWMVVMCIKEEFWRRLCREIDAPEMAEDPRFMDFEARFQNREVLLSMLKQIFQTRTTEEWLAKLRGKVPSGPIRSFAEVFADPILNERDMIWEVNAPGWGKIKEVGCPIKISGVISPKRPGPSIGEHTQEVLAGLLGYGRGDIERLREKGVV